MEQLIDSIIRKSYESFKLEEAFSKQEDVYMAVVELAYRDAQRTMRGIGSVNDVKNSVLRNLSCGIGEYVNGLRQEQSFDSVHNELCELWTNQFEGELAKYGKAQKIVNMSFKYLYTYYYQTNDTRIERLTDGHFTLDSYTLKWLNACAIQDKPVSLDSSTSWSKLNEEEYMKIQEYSKECISRMLPGLNRIKAEFLIWEITKIHELTKTWSIINRNADNNQLIDIAKRAFIQDEHCSLMRYLDEVRNIHQI